MTSIGDKAFYNCSSLQAIVIPDSVTSIGNEAFKYCDSLQSIQIPKSVTDIGKSAFAYTGLTSVVLPEGIESINMGTFADCRNLRHVQLPKTLRTIEQGAFGGSGLRAITIPEGVTEIGMGAFFNSRIQRVIIPSTIRKIEDQVGSFAGEVFLFLTDLTQLEIELGHGRFGDLYVPSKIQELCKQHPVLGKFRKIDSIENVIASMKLRYDRYW